MKLQIKCKICGKLCPSNQYLGLHLKQHNIKAKNYYDTYLKEIGDGYCIVCGKQTKFKTLEIGYNLHCCNSCGTKDKIVQTKKQNTNYTFVGWHCLACCISGLCFFNNV